MSIEWFRDLIISIWGLVAMGVLIFVAVLSYSLYRRIKPILESTKATSRTIQGISTYAGDKVAKPLIEDVHSRRKAVTKNASEYGSVITKNATSVGSPSNSILAYPKST